MHRRWDFRRTILEGATDWVMDLNIKDAFDESVTDIYEGLDDLAGQINATESNLGDLTGAFNTLRMKPSWR